MLYLYCLYSSRIIEILRDNVMNQTYRTTALTFQNHMWAWISPAQTGANIFFLRRSRTNLHQWKLEQSQNEKTTWPVCDYFVTKSATYTDTRKHYRFFPFLSEAFWRWRNATHYTDREPKRKWLGNPWKKIVSSEVAARFFMQVCQPHFSLKQGRQEFRRRICSLYSRFKS